MSDLNGSLVNALADRLKRWFVPDGMNRSVDHAGTSPTLADMAVLSKLGSVEVIAKQIVDGLYAGLHRSRLLGGTSDFKEYRPYGQGDELRRIDWRLFARRDRAYVRQYVNETNLTAWIVADASGSMAFARSTATKFAYARVLTAALGRLLLRQRDAVGLMIQDEQRESRLRPSCRPSHWQAILDILAHITPHGESDITRQICELTQRVSRRGLIVVISDCLVDLDSFAQSLRTLKARQQDVILFQILAPEEMQFPFTSLAEFQDIENRHNAMNANGGRIRQAYLQEFHQFQHRLRETMLRIGVDYHLFRTDQDPGENLACYLMRRGAGLTVPDAAEVAGR